MLKIILALFLLLVPMKLAFAQSNQPDQSTITIDKKRLLVQPRNTDGTSVQVSFLEDPILWVREKQQSFYSAMSGSLRAIKSKNPAQAAWTLMLLGFAYGAFHAAGPGHGKAVISAWLLATQNDLRRGIFVAFLSSLFQALTAIIMVSVLFLLVASAGAVAKNLAGYLESGSYAMIALVGLYLIAPVLKKSFVSITTAKPKPVLATVSHPAFAQNFTPLANDPHHVHDANCGHIHAPDPEALRGDWSLWRGASMALAIGLRPCTGAILVLILANALGLYWAGIAATLAMGFGTFLTVAAIAALTIFAKDFALRFAANDSATLGRIANVLRVIGGLTIFLFGLLLFLSSLGNTNGML